MGVEGEDRFGRHPSRRTGHVHQMLRGSPVSQVKAAGGVCKGGGGVGRGVKGGKRRRGVE